MHNKSIMREISEKFLALALILVMLIAVIPAFTINVDAAEADVADTGADVTSGEGTWISDMLEYSYEVVTSSDNTTGASGSVSRSGNTLTVKATSAKEYETGGCNSTTIEAADTTTTVTVENISRYPLSINSLTTGGSASVAGVSLGDTIASGASFTITVKSPANGTNATEKSGTVTISVTEETSVDITLKSSPYVEYTVNNKTVAQNGSDQTFTVDAGTEISLPAINAPSGYKFAGWRIGSELRSNINKFTADAGYDVFPVIVTEGTSIDAGNFKVGNATYTFWEDAVVAAVSGGGKLFVNSEVVNLPANVLDNTLPASGGTYVKPAGDGVEYILPASVTLVVPFSTSTTVHTTTPDYSTAAHVTPSPFRTLTVPSGAKITVNGAVSVDSHVCANGTGSKSWQATPSGPHGKIVMKSGAEMTFNSGANLYCYGYINGDGNIYVKSGAKVYELFQDRSYRGGSATSDMQGNSKRVFPLPMYYVQNVEAPMIMYKGATEYVWTVATASGSAYPSSQIEFVGTNGMFKLTGSNSDYITKRYHANVDRLEVAAHGNMELNALNVEITGLPFIGTIDIKSSAYVLPLNNMDIVVQTGTTSIAATQQYGVAFIPGSKLTVNEGATFNVNAPTYFYDVEDWGLYATNGSAYVPVGYSTANGATNIRTAENLEDAELDLNGTMTVSDKLYTTVSGAHITSSKGTGTINFSSAAATGTTTTYQATYADETISYHDITCNNAWLQNGDESYSETVSTGKSTWKYDKSGEHWYRYLVDFKYNDTLIDRGYYCENNDTVTYDASWLDNLDATASNGTAAISGSNINVTGVTADSVVTLTGTPKEYIPTFVLSEEEYRHYKLYNSGDLGETVEINGATYYVVKKASSAMPVGETFAAPTDEEMGVSADSHNDIIWNMSGLSYTSGDPYRGIVPAGETAQGPAYIYGFYTGVVAYNSYTDEYYDTLIGAFEVLPQDVSATITLLADCGTFEEESSTVTYMAYPSNNITLDLNGHNAVGKISNKGTFDLEMNGGSLTGSITNSGTFTSDFGGGTMTGTITNSGSFTSDLDGGLLKSSSSTVPITNNAGKTFNLDLNGGTVQRLTNASAAASGYRKAATVVNDGTLNISDTAGGGKIIGDAIDDSSTLANYSSVVRNNSGATLNMTGGTLQNKPASVNNYSMALMNYGTASISDSTFTTTRGYGVYNTSSGTISLLKDSTASVTNKSGAYAVMNNAGKITKISGSTLSTINTIALYNYVGASLTTLENTNISVTTPSTVNVYALTNYGSTITTMDGCTISGNSGINNRNYRGDANTVATGATISKYGNIGTIKNTTVNVGQYAVYNGATIGTMIDSTFTASPASSIVYGTYGTSNLNKDYPQCYTVFNSNNWWYDTAVWKQTNTYVDNDGTSMLQHRTNEYKTTDDYMPTIGAITNCTINAANTSASAAYGYALVNYGVINDINGSSTIQTYKHPDNTSTKLTGSQFALQNINGGKIGSIGSDVTISAQTYAIDNRGARYATTDVDYSTTYLASGALKSGGLATDYDYTFADVSTIGSIAGTVSATSSAAIQNYSKINSISGDISAPYNVVVNQIAATTTTSIEVATANERVIEHRRFTNDDSSLAANEIGRDFEYTRNTTDGCTIGEITGTVTATGAGYQAIYNYGHIGTLGGTVTTPTGKATSSSTYYPLIFNGDQRQASLKQTEDYYVESNDYGATKYLREYTYDVPTIDTISCTATNPQDYTIRNLGTINTLSGDISGKTITVANEASGTYRTRKTITYYSSASLLAATKASTEVNYEYTKDQAKINNIDGATISTTGTTLALRNYGYVGEIKDSTITSTTTYTIQNGAATTNSTVTSYTSNRLDVLTGCTPSSSACALAYDQSQTINEDAVRAPATINKIGAGNYFQGTYFTLYNMGRINEIDSGSGKKSIIYGSSRQALYNLQGCYSRVTNTDAVLTNATGTTTNNYTYEYAPAYIGTIKNVFILGKRQAILNGDGTADYCAETPVTIGEIGEGTEARTSATATYNAVQNNKTYARIGEISGGVYMTGTGSGIYALNNDGTAYPIMVSGGDFRGGDGTRALAIKSPDTASKYTYPAGMKLSTGTETATYYTLSNKVLTAKTNSFYYIQGLTYNVTWKNGSTTLETDTDVAGGSTPTYNGSTPTKAATDEFTYEFDGWTSSVDGQVYATADLPPVAADVTYTAHFKETKNKYTVTWDVDGTTTTEEYEYGAIPSYVGVPTKAEDAQYTYAFSCWDPSPAAVTGNITYTAQFTPTVKTYEITWIDGNGETLKTEQVAYGETPSYSGETPTKTGDAQYSYTFNNTWSPAITSVTGPKTYTAQFDSSVNEYTITWNVDGTTTTSDVAYGQTPVYPGETPTKAGDAQYGYTFAGWSTDGETVIATLPDVSANATYIAVFTRSVNKYTVTWKVGDTTVETDENVEYNTVPTFNGETPTKASDAQYSYTFAGWSTDGKTVIDPLTGITGNTTYIAVFDQTTNTYTVKWTVDESASEQDIKAGVDAVIANHAQAVYNAVEADISPMGLWNGTNSKIEFIQLTLLDQYGFNYDDAGYVAAQIVSVVENNADAAADAESRWNGVKDTIVESLASSSLTTAAEKSELNALAGGVTTLETDNNVPYGTVPTFNGNTPTKEGDAQYSYTFSGWSTDGTTVIDPLPDVSGNVTYKAVFTQTVNTYTVQWVIDDSPSEEELKTAVDALIAEVAQNVYNDAKTEGDMMWDMGWMSHEELVKMHLDAGHVGSQESAAYIAKRIIEIVDNNSADFSAADALWDSCKDTVVADFAAFSGYTNADTGVTYSGLTPAQKSSMEALSGGKTILEIDKNVPYGTTPEYNGVNPTKAATDKYTYLFAGWTPTVAPVTGNVTYTAVFQEEEIFNKHSLTLDGNIGVNFYMLLPAGYNADNTTMDFYWGNKYISTNTYSETEPYSETGVTGTVDEKSDLVKFTVKIAAKELNDEITAVLKDSSGETIATDTYRGTDYAYDILTSDEGTYNTETDDTKDAKLKELVKDLLIYSADAQVNFKYHKGEKEAFSDLATYRFEDLEISDELDAVDTSKLKGNSIGALPSGVSYYGSSLNLGSETSYMVVFRNNNKLDLTLTAKYSGTDTELETSVKNTNSGTATGLSVLNLPAARVLDDVAITIKNGSDEYEATVNTGTYFKTVLNGNYAQELKDVLTALYHYNRAASEFFD